MSNAKKSDQLGNKEIEILKAYESGKLNGAPASSPMVFVTKETMKKQRDQYNDVSQ